MKDMDKCDACIASGKADTQTCQDCWKADRKRVEQVRRQRQEAGGENERG